MSPETPAQVLAQFWAGHLVGPAPQPLGEDPVTDELYRQLAEQQVHSPQEGERLRASLAQLAQAQLTRQGYAYTYTDSGALGLLRAAAERAGVTLGPASLPCRTSVVARAHEVEVRLGVGSPWRTLWSAAPREPEAVREVKARAHEVLTLRRAQGQETLQFADVLEELARQAGERDWNIYRARLAGETPSPHTRRKHGICRSAAQGQGPVRP